MKKIGIINYSLGNVGSVCSAFKFYGYKVNLINMPNELKNSDFLVLAGVGNFLTAVMRLKEFKFWDELNKQVLIKKKPILGICLGMQLFADKSYESKLTKGFGWLNGDVIKISETKKIKIPHIGWNIVMPVNKNSLFKDMRYNSFYFMHSFHFIPKDESIVISNTDYCGINIVSAVKKNNIVGVQFHPEKSQGDGLRLLRNFIEELN